MGILPKFLLLLLISRTILSLNLRQSAADVLARSAASGVGVIRTRAEGGNVTGTSTEGTASSLTGPGRSADAATSGRVDTGTAGIATSEGATTSTTEAEFGAHDTRTRFDTSGASGVDVRGGAGFIDTGTSGRADARDVHGAATTTGDTGTTVDVSGNAFGNTDTASTGTATTSPAGVRAGGTTASGSDLTVVNGTGRTTTDIEGTSAAHSGGISGSSSTFGSSDVNIHGPGSASTSGEGSTDVDIARFPHHPPPHPNGP
jgi:hypothetical protein